MGGEWDTRAGNEWNWQVRWVVGTCTIYPENRINGRLAGGTNVSKIGAASVKVWDELRERGREKEQKKVEVGRDRVDSGSTGRSPSREGGEIDWIKTILMEDTDTPRRAGGPSYIHSLRFV